MAFLLKEVTDITVPVTIQIPGEESTCKISARWRLHDVPDAQKRQEQMQKSELSEDQLVEEDLLDIEGMSDEKGKPLKLTKDIRDQLMRKAYIRRPLVLSWFAAQQGRGEAAAKN
ncbi:hypothetical protein [Modicisalibacter coralii]|uniref:hypothetical protein n=1 Tax=Modicisalibacter coralii TaxID=2304602 RepID=UPI00100A976D|nr:hypothetical protein [Halomonas coralii]